MLIRTMNNASFNILNNVNNAGISIDSASINTDLRE